ncbi:hypothetical protein H7F15_03630 [Pontibacter sp. Tf4]|uniref:hypothetical protein n=1 Tax=Pontibacter sp. Tf4 TaxID=2761620 RepID=UPI0016271BBC|nr:hypothetical protein [Pontibacter sp. Tf4]MBB6610119.1 hypothetical protein [Pontibacter sp. Tf4]
MKLIIGFVVVILLWMIYFATQLSATYAPLKSYRFSMTTEELQERLFQVVDTNPNMTLNLSDSTGTDKENRHYHADILIKGETEEYEFSISYYTKDGLWKNNDKSVVSLVGAFDRVNRTGGYKIDNTDIEKLITVFENQVINKIDKNSSR